MALSAFCYMVLQDIINFFIIIRGDPPRGRLIIERTRIYSRPNALPLGTPLLLSYIDPPWGGAFVYPATPLNF